MKSHNTEETHKHNMPECFRSAAYIKSYGLSRWMSKHGVTRPQIAEAMDVSLASVCNWMQNDKKPMSQKAIRLLYLFLYAHGINGLRKLD